MSAAKSPRLSSSAPGTKDSSRLVVMRCAGCKREECKPSCSRRHKRPTLLLPLAEPSHSSSTSAANGQAAAPAAGRAKGKKAQRQAAEKAALVRAKAKAKAKGDAAAGSVVDKFRRKTRVRRAARQFLLERFESMWDCLPAALAGDAEAGIHQMRVESKRLREAMRLFGKAYRTAEFERLLQGRCAITVIDHQPTLVLMGKLGQLPDVGHFTERIRRRFQK